MPHFRQFRWNRYILHNTCFHTGIFNNISKCGKSGRVLRPGAITQSYTHQLFMSQRVTSRSIGPIIPSLTLKSKAGKEATTVYDDKGVVSRRVPADAGESNRR